MSKFVELCTLRSPEALIERLMRKNAMALLAVAKKLEAMIPFLSACTIKVLFSGRLMTLVLIHGFLILSANV
jgi:hypothetical protein